MQLEKLERAKIKLKVRSCITSVHVSAPPPSVIKWPLHQQHQVDFDVHSQAADPETCAAVLVATLLLLLCLPYYSGSILEAAPGDSPVNINMVATSLCCTISQISMTCTMDTSLNIPELRQ